MYYHSKRKVTNTRSEKEALSRRATERSVDQEKLTASNKDLDKQWHERPGASELHKGSRGITARRVTWEGIKFNISWCSMVVKIKSISDEGKWFIYGHMYMHKPRRELFFKKLCIWLIKIISQSSKMGTGAPSWDSGYARKYTEYKIMIYSWFLLFCNPQRTKVAGFLFSIWNDWRYT